MSAVTRHFSAQVVLEPGMPFCACCCHVRGTRLWEAAARAWRAQLPGATRTQAEVVRTRREAGECLQRMWLSGIHLVPAATTYTLRSCCIWQSQGFRSGHLRPVMAYESMLLLWHSQVVSDELKVIAAFVTAVQKRQTLSKK